MWGVRATMTPAGGRVQVADALKRNGVDRIQGEIVKKTDNIRNSETGER